jgi:flagellar motor switch protein FliN/FliY
MATVLAMPKSEPAAISDASWQEANWLPCRLSVEMPILGFTMGDLLRLEVDSLVDTHIASDANVPLRVNGALIGWAEFEVVGDRLGVRLTELA